VVETGGVGYEVIISIPTFSGLPALGAEVCVVHPYARPRRRAGLFGFLKPADKQLFEKLLSVSGIGPKLAITILSGMSSDAMVAAIRGNNVALLTRIPGIGKKDGGAHGAGAARQTRFFRDNSGGHGGRYTGGRRCDFRLVNLGYQRPVVERAMGRLEKGGEEPFDTLFRKILAALAK